MVKRYSVYLPHYETGEIEEMPDGEYVQYTDYAALAERCERLEGALRSVKELPALWRQFAVPRDSDCMNSRDCADDLEAALSPSSGGGE